MRKEKKKTTEFNETVKTNTVIDIQDPFTNASDGGKWSDIDKRLFEKATRKPYSKQHRLYHILTIVALFTIIILVVFLGATSLEFFGVKIIYAIIIGIIFYALMYFLEFVNINNIALFISLKEKNGLWNKIIFLIFIGSINIASVYVGIQNTKNKAITTDNVTISTTTNKDSLNIVSEFNKEYDRLTGLIAVVQNNPQGWSSGKRSCLTSDQLTQIDNYNSQISSLLLEKNNTLSQIYKEKEVDIEKNTTKHIYKSQYVFLATIILEVLIVLLMFSIANYPIKAKREMVHLKITDIVKRHELGDLSDIEAVRMLSELNVKNISVLLPTVNLDEIKKSNKTKDVAQNKNNSGETRFTSGEVAGEMYDTRNNKNKEPDIFEFDLGGETEEQSEKKRYSWEKSNHIKNRDISKNQ